MDVIDFGLKVLSMLDNPAVVVAAAATKDVSKLREYLTRFPQSVRKAEQREL